MIGYYKHAPFSLFLRILVSLAIAITVCTLGFLILYILVKGIPFLKPSLFSLTYTSENVSFLPSILMQEKFNRIDLVQKGVFVPDFAADDKAAPAQASQATPVYDEALPEL